jgi:MJ1316 RNA cyclic group end recognition domain
MALKLSQFYEPIEPKKPKKPRTKRVPEDDGKKKKGDRMRTSSDVIKRLQWDENLPQEFFTIGYVDRYQRY